MLEMLLRLDYPKEFYYSRESILKRDNYKCQECGVVHKKYIIRNGDGKFIYISKQEYEENNKNLSKCYRIYLQVAHLDNDRTNNDSSNLRCLCLWCHLKYDKNYKLLMRLAKKKGKHSSLLSNPNLNPGKPWLLFITRTDYRTSKNNSEKYRRVNKYIEWQAEIPPATLFFPPIAICRNTAACNRGILCSLPPFLNASLLAACAFTC